MTIDTQSVEVSNSKSKFFYASLSSLGSCLDRSSNIIVPTSFEELSVSEHGDCVRVKFKNNSK
jgi:hypothetical protein